MLPYPAVVDDGLRRNHRKSHHFDLKEGTRFPNRPTYIEQQARLAVDEEHHWIEDPATMRDVKPRPVVGEEVYRAIYEQPKLYHHRKDPVTQHKELLLGKAVDRLRDASFSHEPVWDGASPNKENFIRKSDVTEHKEAMLGKAVGQLRLDDHLQPNPALVSGRFHKRESELNYVMEARRESLRGQPFDPHDPRPPTVYNRQKRAQVWDVTDCVDDGVLLPGPASAPHPYLELKRQPQNQTPTSSAQRPSFQYDQRQLFEGSSSPQVEERYASPMPSVRHSNHTPSPPHSVRHSNHTPSPPRGSPSVHEGRGEEARDWGVREAERNDVGEWVGRGSGRDEDGFGYEQEGYNGYDQDGLNQQGAEQESDRAMGMERYQGGLRWEEPDSRPNLRYGAISLQEWRSPEEERMQAKFRRPRHNELWDIPGRSDQADHPINYQLIKEERMRRKAEEAVEARAELMRMVEKERDRKRVLAEAKRPYTAPAPLSPRRIGRSDGMRLSRINDDMILVDMEDEDAGPDPLMEARVAKEMEEERELAKLAAQDAVYNKDRGRYARGRGGGADFYRSDAAMGFTREQIRPQTAPSISPAGFEQPMRNLRPSWWG